MNAEHVISDLLAAIDALDVAITAAQAACARARVVLEAMTPAAGPYELKKIVVPLGTFDPANPLVRKALENGDIEVAS